MANRKGKMEDITGFIFLNSKVTSDGDCRHEIKIHLVLRRKAMTNLDRVLKSRDIILWIKVCIKEINPEFLVEELMLKLKLQHFGHLMKSADSLEKTLLLEKIDGRRRRGQQRMR